MSNAEQLFGESSSSESSEESSSEEEQQVQQPNGAEVLGDGAQDQSSTSDSEGDQSGSGSEQEEEGDAGSGEEEREEEVREEEEEEEPVSDSNRNVTTTAQDLFGGESSSESSSESGEDQEGEGAESNASSSKSSSDEEMQEQPNAEPEGDVLKGTGSSQTMEELFGGEADLSSSDDEIAPTRRVHEEVDFANLGDEDDDEVGVAGDNVEEGEGQEEVEEEAPRINVDIPRCVAHLGSDLYFVKLPNFLSVETRPFDSELYEDEGEEDEVLDEEGRARLKLKVENTIRWRYVQDEAGNEVRESNARVVRWSDGSMSLYLGSEIFDISKQPLQGEYSHLFVRQGTGLQGQAVFKNKVTFRPHSTDSQTHRKMTLSIADRFSKAQKIRVLPAVGMNPESQRNERIKKAEERLRIAVRQEQKRKSMEYNVRNRNKSRVLRASYLDPDAAGDLDLEEDISAIKSSIRSRIGGKRGAVESSNLSSEEEEEIEERLARAKDMTEESSPPAKKMARRSRGGDKKGARSRKILSSSEEDSD